MAIASNHLLSSLRLLDNDGAGLRTFSHIRPNINAQAVGRLLNGFNIITAVQATTVTMTTQTELVPE